MRAFDQQGKSHVVVAAVTSPAGTEITLNAGEPKESNQYRIANSGSVGVHYAYSTTSAADAAAKCATLPSGATGQYCYYLPAGAVEIITAPRVDGTTKIWFSAQSVSSTSNVYINRGIGI